MTSSTVSVVEAGKSGSFSMVFLSSFRQSVIGTLGKRAVASYETSLVSGLRVMFFILSMNSFVFFRVKGLLSAYFLMILFVKAASASCGALPWSVIFLAG